MPIVAAVYIHIVVPPHIECRTIDTLVYLCMPLHFLEHFYIFCGESDNNNVDEAFCIEYHE